MKILLYSISYSPELAGSGRFNGEIAEWFSERGHTVDVITAHPYYPEWKVRDDYTGKGWFTEKAGNLTVYRTPLFVPKNVTGLTRIVHEISFVINSAVHWCKVFFRRYDVVIGVCPPLQVGIFPYLYSIIWRRPFLFHIQDLQVDAARSLEMIKNGLLLTILDKFEQFLLNKATWVSSISEGMKQRIISKGVKEENYFMLENWVDTKLFKPIPPEDSFKHEYGFDYDDKIVLYSGNIGQKQGLEILIEAAALLQLESNIKIVICGEGATKQALQGEATKRKLKNVFFFPVCQYDQLPRVLAMADVHLIIQKRAASDLVMPSKLSNVLAMGGASIVSADENTWLHHVVKSNELGWVIEPECADSLALAIKNLIYSNQLLFFRENARLFAAKYLDKNYIMNRFETFLLNNVS